MNACFEERPVFFPGPHETLAGMLTVPSDPNGYVVLQSWGTSPHPSSGMNRMRARLAHLLAEDGFASFRFDWPGQAESMGTYERASVSSNLVGECRAAESWLRAQGYEHVLVLGLCFGGHTAILSAPHMGRLEGLVAISPPVARNHEEALAKRLSLWTLMHAAMDVKPKDLADREWRRRRMSMVKAKLPRFVPGASQPTGKLSSPLVGGIDHLMQQGTPVLILTNEGNDFRDDLEEFVDQQGLTMQMAKVRPSRFVVLDDPVRGLASVRLQDELISQVRTWFAELPKQVESTVH